MEAVAFSIGTDAAIYLAISNNQLTIQSPMTFYSDSTPIRGFGYTLDRLLDSSSSFTTNLFHAIEGSQLIEENGIAKASFDLPGFKQSEIKVEAAHDYVTVTAENKARGKVSRAFYVNDVDADKIVAKLEDGVLKLSLPIRTESLPRKVEVT